MFCFGFWAAVPPRLKVVATLAPPAVSAARGCAPHGQWALLDADLPALVDRPRVWWSLGIADGASSAPSRACAGRMKHVRRRVRSLLAKAHREAMLKVLSLLRAARSELLCRCRLWLCRHCRRLHHDCIQTLPSLAGLLAARHSPQLLSLSTQLLLTLVCFLVACA